MSWREKVQAEVDRLSGVELRRGALYEDERERLKAFRDVQQWETEDEVAVVKTLAQPAADPNQETKDLFASYRGKLKEGKRS